MLLVVLPFFLFPSTIAVKPDTSENLKMMVINGNPVYSTGVVPESRDDWTHCLEDCRITWNCALVTQTVTGCDFLLLNQVKSITLLEFDPKVAFKINLLDQCPLITENPPLFGKSTSEVIETNGIDYFKTQVIDNTGNELTFNFTMFKCLRDFPENPVLRGADPKRVVYPLTSIFTTEDEFLMKGKIAPTFDVSFSISFYCSSDDTYPLFIKVINGKKSTPYTSSAKNHGIEISTWINGNVRYPETIQGYPSPYNNSDAFELRVNSSDTQVFLHLNGTTTLTFDLNPKFPLNTTDQFIINASAEVYEIVNDYFFGWSGECWWEPMA